MELLVDTVAYYLVSGILMGALALAACILLLPIVFVKGHVYYVFVIVRVLVVGAFLFAWGLIGNLVWHQLVLDRLYVNPDTFADFTPFMPAGLYNTIDPGCGGHLLPGHSMFKLLLAWAAIAVPFWAVGLACGMGCTRRRFLLPPQSLARHAHPVIKPR